VGGHDQRGQPPAVADEVGGDDSLDPEADDIDEARLTVDNYAARQDVS
jgi:hypothetical protein